MRLTGLFDCNNNEIKEGMREADRKQTSDSNPSNQAWFYNLIF